MRATMKAKTYVPRRVDRISPAARHLCQSLDFGEDALEYKLEVQKPSGKFQAGQTYFLWLDIVHVPSKTAIEIDGSNHRLVRQRQIDQWKTAVLTGLGWKVLRYSNQEVMSETARVVTEVNLFMTLRSKGTTTSS